MYETTPTADNIKAALQVYNMYVQHQSGSQTHESYAINDGSEEGGLVPRRPKFSFFDYVFELASPLPLPTSVPQLSFPIEILIPSSKIFGFALVYDYWYPDSDIIIDSSFINRQSEIAATSGNFYATSSYNYTCDMVNCMRSIFLVT